MKRGWKIFWIICAAMGVLGIGCCIVAAGMGATLEAVEERLPNGISIGTYETEDAAGNELDHDSHHSYEGITGLDIDLTAGELEILVSNDHHISVATEGISKKLKLRHYRDGDDLVITSKKNVMGIINQSIGTVYIYLPESYILDEAEINVHAGTLYIEDIHADELSIDVGAGEAVIDNFVAKEADLDCGTGEIYAFGTADKMMDIDCGMGRIEFATYDSENNYNYELACGIGEIECGSNSYAGIGSDHKVDNNAPKSMNIDCGIGEVAVYFEENRF